VLETEKRAAKVDRHGAVEVRPRRR
jgi:hypothetical protein